jgi:hypothetical protein
LFFTVKYKNARMCREDWQAVFCCTFLTTLRLFRPEGLKKVANEERTRLGHRQISVISGCIVCCPLFQLNRKISFSKVVALRHSWQIIHTHYGTSTWKQNFLVQIKKNCPGVQDSFHFILGTKSWLFSTASPPGLVFKNVYFRDIGTICRHL